MSKNCASPYSHSKTVLLKTVNQDFMTTPKNRRRFIEANIRAPLNDNEYQLWVRFYATACGRAVPGSQKLMMKVLSPNRSQYFEWVVRSHIARSGQRLPGIIKKNVRFPISIVLKVVVLDLENIIMILQRKTLHDFENGFNNRGRNLIERSMPLIFETVSIENLSKHQHRIKSDEEYRDKAALKSEVINTAYTVFSQPPPVRVGEPGSESEPWDHNYPEFTSRAHKWREMLGIQPDDTGTKALWHVFRTVFVTDFIEVVRLGTLQGSRIADKLNYMIAGHISHKQGYDRGRSRKALEDAVEEGLVHKVHKSADDMDDGRQVEYEIPDNSYYAKRDHIENHMLLQQIRARVTDKRDLMALNLYYKIAQGSTLEEEFKRHKVKCQQLGLNSPSAVSKRIQRMPEKYNLQELNPFAPEP
jgi:hypothetical protein